LLAVFVFRRNLGAELSLLAMLGIVDGVPTTPHVTILPNFLVTGILTMLPLSAYSAYGHDVVQAQPNQ
jgi:hypothetical protein